MQHLTEAALRGKPPFVRSSQVRADHLAGVEPRHPMVKQMAETLRDIAAIGQGVSFRDLVGAGFTSAQIIEFGDAAEALAKELSDKQLTIAPDLLADIVLKACAPMPNNPPLPNGTRESQALFQMWGGYCAARASYTLDPWSGQRERCHDKLMDYLQQLPLLPRDRKHVARKMAETLSGKAARDMLA